jgi:hypothetical protein
MSNTPIPFTVRVINGTITVAQFDKVTVVVGESATRVVQVGGPAGVSTFFDLSDTNFTSLVADDLAQFDGTEWVNVPTSSVGVTSHLALTDIGVNTHAVIDTHIADGTIHFTDAPADAQTYARRDNAWVEIQTGGALISGVWRFETSTAEVPSSGRFRQDNVVYASVVEIFIADTTRPGFDATNILTALSPGDRLYIQNENDASEWVIWDVDGAVIDEGTWFRIPVNLVNNGDNITNNRDCLIAVLFGGGVGGLSHFDLTDIGVNTHAAIDTHIADATIHFTEASIDHTAISNIGTNSHAAIDTHIADGTTHFTEASIDHTAISNIGTNSHAAIDTHIADGTIHFTLEAVDDQVAGLLQDVEGLTFAYDDGANTLTPVLDPLLASHIGIGKSSWVYSDFTGQSTLLVEGPFRAIGGSGGFMSGTTLLHLNHPGIWCMSTGAAAANGRVFILTSTGLGSWSFGTPGGETRCTSIVHTSPLLSTPTQRYVLRSGFSAVSLPNTLLSAITFEYQDDQNGGRWQGVTADGIGETSVDTGVTVTASTWYKLEIVINADATLVTFFIDDVSVGSTALTIPSGTGFQHFHSDHIMKLVGIGARTFYVDATSIYDAVTR